MTSSEVRLAETIEIFFQAAELSSDGAMAGHAYKRAVDELDTGVGRDLVSFRLPPCLAAFDLLRARWLGELELILCAVLLDHRTYLTVTPFWNQ